MESVSILQVLANSYLYGWAGAAIFLVLFVVMLRQTTVKSGIISKLKKENKTLEQQLSENGEKITKLESQTESLTEETEEKAAEISRLEDRLASTEKELDKKTQKINDLEDQIKNYSNENSELKSRISNLEGKTAEQESLIEQKDAEINKLSEQTGHLEKELDELKFNHNISMLYIHMKKLNEEFLEDYTQNILKGINTMKVSDIDMTTAQAIFEHAMSSFYDISGQPQQKEETPRAETEESEAS
jgi:chromosome segregation ATPase